MKEKGRKTHLKVVLYEGEGEETHLKVVLYEGEGEKTHLKVVLYEGEGQEDLRALLAALDGVVPIDHAVHLPVLDGGPTPTLTPTTICLDGVCAAVVELGLKVWHHCRHTTEKGRKQCCHQGVSVSLLVKDRTQNDTYTQERTKIASGVNADQLPLASKEKWNQHLPFYWANFASFITAVWMKKRNNERKRKKIVFFLFCF